MSLTATRAARKIKVRKARALLDALADSADAQGNVWHALTQERLAEIIECDERTVGRHMKALDDAGVIIRTPQYRHGHRIADKIVIACLIPDKMPGTVDVIPDKMSGMNPVSYPTKCPGKSPSKEERVQDKKEREGADAPAHSAPSASGGRESTQQAAEKKPARLTADFQPDQANKDYAAQRGVNMAKARQSFVVQFTEIKPNATSANWQANFHKWLGNEWVDEKAAAAARLKAKGPNLDIWLKAGDPSWVPWQEFKINHPDPLERNVGLEMKSGRITKWRFWSEWPPSDPQSVYDECVPSKVASV
jgi:hypothetical protein